VKVTKASRETSGPFAQAALLECQVKFHAIANLSGGKQKTIVNKSEDQLFADVILPFVASGVFSAKWGSKDQSYNALEMRVYQSKEAWDKKSGTSFVDFIKGKKNCFEKLKLKADALLATNKPRVFMITPIQGSKHGDQEQQRILKEFDERFAAVEEIIAAFGGILIRIDREHALEDLVGRIKKEIQSSTFVVADLTDERPSCYFEAGYAEALRKPVIYMASQNSVLKPGTPTKVHFDIHMNIIYFSNHVELSEKLNSTVERNKDKLFNISEQNSIVIPQDQAVR
jgi:hypothetical protein